MRRTGGKGMSLETTEENETMNATKIQDGWYGLAPEGSGWCAARVIDGEVVECHSDCDRMDADLRAEVEAWIELGPDPSPQDLPEAEGLAVARLVDSRTQPYTTAVCRLRYPDDPTSNIAAVLKSHGERFAGNNARDEAEEWTEHDFDAETVDQWCEIGCWNAATAAAFRDADLTPEQVATVSASLVEGLDDPADTYTDGCPIYAACNGDIGAELIIEAAKA